MKDGSTDGNGSRPLDQRNPNLAATFHLLYEMALGPEPSTEPSAVEEINSIYDRYYTAITDGSLSLEKAFDDIVAEATDTVRESQQLESSDPELGAVTPGLVVGLWVLELVIFGAGPAYAKAIDADVDIVTLSIIDNLAKSTRKLSAEFPRSALTKLALGVFSDFSTRHQSISGSSPTQEDAVRAAQLELVEAFGRFGLDFMQLHPDLHRILLEEALLFRRPDRTAEMFFEIAEMVAQKSIPEEEKALLLLDIWRERGQLFSGTS
jgi:hypothetical protein